MVHVVMGCVDAELWSLWMVVGRMQRDRDWDCGIVKRSREKGEGSACGCGSSVHAGRRRGPGRGERDRQRKKTKRGSVKRGRIVRS